MINLLPQLISSRELRHNKARALFRSKQLLSSRIQSVLKSLSRQKQLNFIKTINAIKTQDKLQQLSQYLSNIYEIINLVPFDLLEFGFDYLFIRRLVAIAQQTFTKTNQLYQNVIESLMRQIQMDILLILEKCFSVNTSNVQEQSITKLLCYCINSSNNLLKQVSLCIAQTMKINIKELKSKTHQHYLFCNLQICQNSQLQLFASYCSSILSKVDEKQYKRSYFKRLIIKIEKLFRVCYKRKTMNILKPLIVDLFTRSFIQSQSEVKATMSILFIACKWFLLKQNIFKNFQFISRLFYILKLIFNHNFKSNQASSIFTRQCFDFIILPISFELEQFPKQFQIELLRLLACICQRQQMFVRLTNNKNDFICYMTNQFQTKELDVQLEILDLIDSLTIYLPKAQYLEQKQTIIQYLMNQVAENYNLRVQIKILQIIKEIFKKQESIEDDSQLGNNAIVLFIDMGGIYKLGRLQQAPQLEIHDLLDQLFQVYISPVRQLLEVEEEDEYNTDD